MAPAATPDFLLGVLALLLLQSEPPRAAWARTHSLSYEFIIDPKSPSIQQWCKIQGQVDQKIFLFYNCVDTKAKSMGVLGGKVNSTKTWEYQSETLQDVGNRFKQELLDIKPESCAPTAPLILLARMTCYRKAGRNISGSWELGFNKQILLHVDSDQGKWTEVHPRSNCMKEKWQNDMGLTQCLYRTSVDDCGSWLEEFLEQWKENLETRGNWEEEEEELALCR